MARSKLYALARSLTLVASVGAPCLAQAADLLPPPPPPPIAPPIEVGGGWYLRGDVGASVYERSSFTAYGEANVDGRYNQRYYQNGGSGSGGFAGVGIGYQFNPFLRGDITGEYRFSNGIGGSRTYEYTAGYLNGDELRGRINETTKGNFDAAVVLANAYFDLGTWYGVTPFVGGGVGVAFNHISSTQTTGTVSEPTFVTADPCGCNGYYNKTVGAYYQSKTTNSFAWALHAGLAYDVTSNFKVELAYRYLNLGSARTGAGYEPCCTQSVGFYKEKTIEAHDVKIGLRYLIGGYAAPLPPLMADYQPAPGPLVRKY
ncbi:outer membrane protein [Methylobacterium soli]|uniref:Porin family protein n=1 Tax=Methylobacterium soli TaxID=553447 RepID=A0A6L3T2N5_9HYPH|nr:outer membrane beta-barrel protein [Methylobacterium soli]KAB1080177.1 porin family protein [Methylobacterium soli]GJE45194.1 Putative adhesin RP828 [Methylobacterium soli]